MQSQVKESSWHIKTGLYEHAATNVFAYEKNKQKNKLQGEKISNKKSSK